MKRTRKSSLDYWNDHLLNLFYGTGAIGKSPNFFGGLIPIFFWSPKANAVEWVGSCNKVASWNFCKKFEVRLTKIQSFLSNQKLLLCWQSFCMAHEVGANECGVGACCCIFCAQEATCLTPSNFAECIGSMESTYNGFMCNRSNTVRKAIAEKYIIWSLPNLE